MLAKPRGDLLDAQPLGEQQLQRILVHRSIFSCL